jgi:hypothetical protein
MTLNSGELLRLIGMVINSVMDIRFEKTKFPPKEWIPDMLRLGLIINPRAELFLIIINGVVAGCCGLLIKKGGTCLFKTDYILPEFRGIGLHRHTLTYRIAYCYQIKATAIIANCTKMSVKNYLTFGFVPTKFFRNGIVAVRLEL